MLPLLLTINSTAQVIASLLIVVFVLFLTGWVTKWIGNYQKEKAPGENIHIVETKRIAPNKFLEIVRIGDKYYALGIGRDEVNLIGEIDEDSLVKREDLQGTFSFKDFLNKARDDGEKESK